MTAASGFPSSFFFFFELFLKKMSTFTLLKLSVWQRGKLPEEEEWQGAVVRQGRLYRQHKILPRGRW